MSGINKVIILGNVGSDPDSRLTTNGKLVVLLSVATSKKWKSAQAGETHEKTEWHRVVLFDKVAEIVEKYVSKGDKIYIEGELQTRKWQDNNGVDRYTTEIVGNKIELLGGKQQQPRQGVKGTDQENQYFDDDIPF